MPWSSSTRPGAVSTLSLLSASAVWYSGPGSIRLHVSCTFTIGRPLTWGRRGSDWLYAMQAFLRLYSSPGLFSVPAVAWARLCFPPAVVRTSSAFSRLPQYTTVSESSRLAPRRIIRRPPLPDSVPLWLTLTRFGPDDGPRCFYPPPLFLRPPSLPSPTGELGFAVTILVFFPSFAHFWIALVVLLPLASFDTL